MHKLDRLGLYNLSIIKRNDYYQYVQNHENRSIYFFDFTFFGGCDIILTLIEVWLSLVERHVRDVEAVGSNPVTSTYKMIHNFSGVFFSGKLCFFMAIL